MTADNRPVGVLRPLSAFGSPSQDSPAASAPAAAAGTPPRSAARVLIVDPDHERRQSSAQALGEAGYDVAQATTANAAVRLAPARRPDLSLLDADIVATSTSGPVAQLLERLGAAGIPFVLVGGSALPVHYQADAAAAAIALLPRGIPPLALIDCVRRHLPAATAGAPERLSEANYSELFHSNPQPMWVYDTHSLRFLAVNDAAVSHYGYTRSEFLEMTILDTRPREDWPRLYDSLPAAGIGFESHGLWRHVKKDGSTIDVEISSHDLSFEDRPARLVLIIDVTKRRAIEAQQRLLLTAVAQLNDIVIITEGEIRGAGPRIVFVNNAFERETGYRRDEAIGRTPQMFYGPKTDLVELERVRSAARAGMPSRLVVSAYTKSGAELVLEMEVTPLLDDLGRVAHLVIVHRDITERMSLEAKLRQSQRLEAIGQLTGGVAHDFNNLLTVIMGNAELLAERSSLPSRPRALALSIAHAAARASELTKRLLAFARKQTLDPKSVDINHLVCGVDTLLRRTLGEHIDVALSLQDSLWCTLVDPGQLENALVNLCVNARDAMPNGGRLTIETRNTHLDEAYAAQRLDVQPGDYAVLSVTDTGAGIAPEHLAMVFEPFFTTKDVGKGTGLGLAMVYGFIKQSGGHVAIYSEVGEGTTVRIYLPRQLGQGAPELQDTASGSIVGGRERVLLVEDDTSVRDYARGQLEALGYEVLEEASGPAALDVLRGPEHVDLLFTDVVMPGGMSGKQLAEQALQLRPGLRILFSSGYAENAIAHQGRLDPGVRLLVKPYRRADLSRAVREVLDARCGR